MQFLAKNDIDLLVTDFHLPEQDGLALIDAVIEAGLPIKMAVLSAEQRPAILAKLAERGVDYYTKPVMPSEYAELLARIIEEASE